MSLNAPIPIDGPPPIPPPFNLFTVADQIDNDEIQRWMNGVVVEAYPVDVPFGHDPCGTGSTRVKSTGETPPLPPFKAFDAYVPISCTRWTMNSRDAEFRRRVQAVLDATDHWRGERELATGELMGNPALADANMAGGNILGSGLNPVEGLARLEDAIAETGRQGVIHAPPSIVAAWGFDRLRVDARILRTTAGTPVVSGQGYVDVLPAAGGALGATKQWAFATGPLRFGRGAPRVLPETPGQATDRENNTTTYRAERALLVAWDTVLQVGVEIDRAA